MDQWNGTDSPEINPRTSSLRILDKGAKAHRKGQFLQQMGLGKLKIHTQKNETGLLSNTTYKN